MPAPQASARSSGSRQTNSKPSAMSRKACLSDGAGRGSRTLMARKLQDGNQIAAGRAQDGDGRRQHLHQHAGQAGTDQARSRFGGGKFRLRIDQAIAAHEESQKHLFGAATDDEARADDEAHYI